MTASRWLVVAALLALIGCGQSHAPDAKETPKEPPKKNEPVRPVVSEAPKPAEMPKPPPAKDDFAVGSKFKGKRTMSKIADQPISLIVTKRDGADFEGELTIGGGKAGPLTVKVTGKAGLTNGTVAFSSEKVGEFQQSFTGEYIDGSFSFECKGKTRNGQDGGGKGVLKREK